MLSLFLTSIYRDLIIIVSAGFLFIIFDVRFIKKMPNKSGSEVFQQKIKLKIIIFNVSFLFSLHIINSTRIRVHILFNSNSEKKCQRLFCFVQPSCKEGIFGIFYSNWLIVIKLVKEVVL